MKKIQLHIQALKTSAIIIFAISVFLLIIYSFFDKEHLVLEISILTLFLFTTIYFIFKVSVKRFTYSQLKKIYASTLFDTKTSLNKNDFESDFEDFLEKITEIVETKHLEIEKLHNREDFRKEFLGNVSHELKTPIFTAQGYILTLLEEDFKDPILRKKYLERANKSIDRLHYIVKDLDMISKLESGMDLNFESFNIIKLINDVFELLEIKAAKKNIILTFDKIYDFPILVKGDKKRIEQVLTNLISNAISYGKNKGETIVSVADFSKQTFLIKVSDNGIGISKTNVPRLFERFYRVDQSRSREQGGSGLGLAIVKHIVEAHQQQLFIESDMDKGSSFSFTLKKVI